MLGPKKEFIELHELWLREPYRQRGYGKLIFDFFEDFVQKKGHDCIVYYAFHPAAIKLCRERGYKEAFYEEQQWYTFSKIL